MKVKVIPLQSFEHEGSHKRGVAFECSKHVADQLVAAGLATLNLGEPAKKAEPTDEKPSLSQADQASQKKTAPKSKRGAKKKTTEL